MRFRSLIVALFISAPVWAQSGGVENGNQIHITVNAAKEFVWDDVPGDVSWNFYTGDLQDLRETGVYTQPPNTLVERWCSMPFSLFHYNDLPLPGRCAFVLISENEGAFEGGLGTRSSGELRPNTRPCRPDLIPPEPPGAPALVNGHCKALLASWAPSVSGDVTGYRVRIGTSPGAPTDTRHTGATSLYIDGLSDAVSYFISVAAVDAGGNVSAASDEVSATTVNLTTPLAPAAILATPFGDGRNFVEWPPVTGNEESLPGDPASPGIRDLAGYRVYRSETANIPTDVEHRIAATSASEYYDVGAGCRTFYYKVTAVDACGVESGGSPVSNGTTATNDVPQSPGNFQAFRAGATNFVSWTAPTHDVSGNPIYVSDYRLERTPPLLATSPVNDSDFTALQDVIGATSAIDANPPPVGQLEAIYYRARTLDDCGNVSAPSASAAPTCSFSGTVTITTPSDGENVAGVVPVFVSVDGGTDTYTGATFTYTHAVNGQTRTFTSSTAGTSWTDIGWLASPAGNYSITATVTNSVGCSSSRRITVNAASSTACCVSMYPVTTTTASCASGSTRCKEVSYRIGNDRCLTAVRLSAMTVGWTDYSGNHPRWQTAKFNGLNIAAVGSWTTSYGGSPNELGTATKTFSGVTPIVSYASPMSSSNTTIVTYVFDKNTDSGAGTTRKVDVFTTNRFVFELLDSVGTPSGVTTTCDMPPLTVN